MDNKVILPWCYLMKASHHELLDLYKENKASGKTVYFKNKEGLWLLTQKGEAELQ